MADISKIVVDGSTEYDCQDIESIYELCALATLNSKNMIIKQTFNVALASKIGNQGVTHRSQHSQPYCFEGYLGGSVAERLSWLG